jgi:hypothetical protein
MRSRRQSKLQHLHPIELAHELIKIKGDLKKVHGFNQFCFNNNIKGKKAKHVLALIKKNPNDRGTRE